MHIDKSINRPNKVTPVEWRLNLSSPLPRHRVASDGALVLLHVDQSAQGNYSCYDNRGLLLHSIKLRLGYPPGLLSVSCRVPNHTHVRCSWQESVKTFLPAEYLWRPCVVDAALHHCDITQPAFWQTTHFLRITESNPLGTIHTTYQMRLHELLKPDPPESVMVLGEDGFPTRLNVSWSYPSSWPTHTAFPLVFQIRYRPLGSMHWSQSPFVIFDALAGHHHQVQVRAQDEVNSDSQWSEWSPQFVARPWAGQQHMEFPSEVLFPEYTFPDNTKPETSTAKSHSEDEGNLGLVIVLVLFFVIFTTVLSLILIMWARQRRRDHVTKQELTSMVKMKSLPI
uniref:Fibronectin type-III domain-containing protein n=1 Tax=Myripristis murdjan TaxID=586833 RepID=A0A667WIY3_9TELE